VGTAEASVIKEEVTVVAKAADMDVSGSGDGAEGAGGADEAEKVEEDAEGDGEEGEGDEEEVDAEGEGEEEDGEEDADPDAPKRDYLTEPLSTRPDVKVLCKNIEGIFRPRDHMILCSCSRCKHELAKHEGRAFQWFPASNRSLIQWFPWLA
jgi:hypothetical protein